MNKSELISEIAEATGMDKISVSKVTEAMFGTIVDALANGDEVKILNFGTFSAVQKSAKIGRNPRTGEVLEIAASKHGKFKFGKAFKDALNETLVS